MRRGGPAGAAVGAHRAFWTLVVRGRATVLICDDDQSHTEALARGLGELSHTVEIAYDYAEAFAISCALDLDAIVAAPFLRDGSALVLPATLGIRRPLLLVLASRMRERVAEPVARRGGFDVQLTKVVDARLVDRLMRVAAQRRLAAVAALVAAQHASVAGERLEP